MTKKVISSLIIFFILIGGCYEASKAVSSPFLFIDFPSIIFVIIIATAYSFSKNSNYMMHFGYSAVYAGWLLFIVGFIALSYQFATSNMEIASLLKANSILWLGVFYGYSIRLIILTIVR